MLTQLLCSFRSQVELALKEPLYRHFMHLAAAVDLQYWALDLFPPEQFDRKGLVVPAEGLEHELLPVVRQCVSARAQRKGTPSKAAGLKNEL
jgi:hypothetical protein